MYLTMQDSKRTSHPCRMAHEPKLAREVETQLTTKLLKKVLFYPQQNQTFLPCPPLFFLLVTLPYYRFCDIIGQCHLDRIYYQLRLPSRLSSFLVLSKLDSISLLSLCALIVDATSKFKHIFDYWTNLEIVLYGSNCVSQILSFEVSQSRNVESYKNSKMKSFSFS